MGPVDEAILAAVEAVPPGRIMTYGDIAEWTGTRSARRVGRVLARYGADVPWHRVIRADGRCATHKSARQQALLEAEGVRFVGDRVVLREHRWDGHV